MTDKKYERLRNSLLENAYDQAICEYGSWQKYQKEQWKSLLFYGEEDLLDLSLALLSGSRRVEYPIPALALSAYTICKFNLDKRIVSSPIVGETTNTRTGETDYIQVLSLNVKFGTESMFRLHLGGHLLARCAAFKNNPLDYFKGLPPDISAFTKREFDSLTEARCPYENEAQQLKQKVKDALTEANNFLYSSNKPSKQLMDEIESEVRMEQSIENLFKNF